MQGLRQIVLTVILLIRILSCDAQENESIVYSSYEIHGHAGFIIPHADEIEQVSNTNPVAIDFNYSRLNSSYNSWKVFNTFWRSGFQAAWFNFMNPEVVGSSFLVSAYAEPIVVHWKKSYFSVRGGGGLSYHTHIYDTIENPANKYFSTRISFPVYISFRFNYNVLPNASFTLAGNYNHISNGGIKQPNFGMNFPTISLGIQYYPAGVPVLSNNYTSTYEKQPGIKVVTEVLSSYRVVDRTDIYPQKGALAVGLAVRLSKQLTRFYALNAGGEIISDYALKEIIMREGGELDHKRIALTAGQDFFFGRAIFTQYFGFYIYSPYEAFRDIYQKYELSYRVTPDISTGVFLKAHLYIAELMGLQLSFQW